MLSMVDYPGRLACLLTRSILATILLSTQLPITETIYNIRHIKTIPGTQQIRKVTKSDERLIEARVSYCRRETCPGNAKAAQPSY
jgi:hypothetical protein